MGEEPNYPSSAALHVEVQSFAAVAEERAKSNPKPRPLIFKDCAFFFIQKDLTLIRNAVVCVIKRTSKGGGH